MKVKCVLSILLLVCCLQLGAQKYSVSTNLIGYAALGTLNFDASYAFTRHLSAVAGVRYNPFTFAGGSSQTQFQLRQLSFSAGIRYWPWHIWSGWWFASKLRYQEYNVGGILGPQTREGDKVGAGLYTGYTYMLSSHFNVEFGVGLWGGIDHYRLYSCPRCGLTVDQGKTGFILPDDIMISFVYVF